MKKLESKVVLLVLLCSFFTTIFSYKLLWDAKYERLQRFTIEEEPFRSQIGNSKILKKMQQCEIENRGLQFTLYGISTDFGTLKLSEDEEQLNQKMILCNRDSRGIQAMIQAENSIWNDVKYFPVPKSTKNKRLTCSFIDSWMTERTYGGKRGHEGCDIMAAKDKAGIYPVLSMTDGVVESIGWLEKGGYRIGIKAPHDGYFYYAHLDQYSDIKKGDKIKAGRLLGFMGNTGYGKEGTRGKFPVHLHVGIYLYEKEKEISINPYWILKFLENHKLKYAYT